MLVRLELAEDEIAEQTVCRRYLEHFEGADDLTPLEKCRILAIRPRFEEIEKEFTV